MFGNFPFLEPFSSKCRLSTRTVDYGLAQLSERELKKRPRRRQREHRLKIISRLFKAIMRAKCVLIML